MYEMPGRLSPDVQKDWELSKNEEANMNDFENCIQVMSEKSISIVQHQDVGFSFGQTARSGIGHESIERVESLWMLPISHTDLTSEGLKWHINLRGLEVLPDDGDQDVVDRIRGYNRLSESVQDCVDTIFVRSPDGSELHVPRPFGKIGKLHYIMVRSCEQVKIGKLRTMVEVIEENSFKKEYLFESVVRGTGGKTWDGIYVDYRLK
ncbi:hypothetical protein TRICI_004914 [Trichomonascus ciferrii]|uniref:Uncharacterized protein n=1 Tax=Trichomonascus ciferrii TaxID=44093 RepID=A0A642UXF7_9ASCO|nr:hypothetical protein TRICI_004914 [Trichomonascus ciferrii]